MTCCKCNKDHSYAVGRTFYCRQCAPPDAIRLISYCYSCDAPNAWYGFTKEVRFCSECKLDGMIKLDFKPCVVCQSRRAIYSYKNECSSHCHVCKVEGMVESTRKKCEVCNNKRVSYGFRGKLRTHCNECRLPGMVEEYKKRCVDCDMKRAYFNFPSQKEPLYCKDCKFDKMVDVKNKRCVLCKTRSHLQNYNGNHEVKICKKCVNSIQFKPIIFKEHKRIDPLPSSFEQLFNPIFDTNFPVSDDLSQI